MKIFKYIFLFSLFLTIFKLIGSLLYFRFSKQLGLDSPEVYKSYCNQNELDFSVDYIHALIINSTCMESYTNYFILFTLLSSIIFLIFCYQFLSFSPRKKILLLYFSLTPTIFFYSAGITKDGFVLIFLMLAFIFRNSLGNLFFLISITLRPFLAANYLHMLVKLPLRSKLIISFFIFIPIALIIYSYWSLIIPLIEIYSSAIQTRFSVSMSNLTNLFSLNGGLIFFMEVLGAIIFLKFYKLGNPIIYISILFLFFISLYNFNVLARMVVMLIFSCIIFQVISDGKEARQ